MLGFRVRGLSVGVQGWKFGLEVSVKLNKDNGMESAFIGP